MKNMADTDTPPGDATRYFSTREAAQRLGVAVRTVQLWVESGVLRAWKTAGGHRRITRESLDALLAARGHATAAHDAVAQSPPAPTVRDSPRFRVLVVEDDPALRMLLEMSLTSGDPPVAVDLAENGFAGLLRIGECRPDLLITDLNMPGMDGFSMIRHLRQTPAWHTLPIVVVSALGPRDIEQRGGLPADIPVFGKPVPFDRLETLIRERLAERARAANQRA